MSRPDRNPNHWWIAAFWALLFLGLALNATCPQAGPEVRDGGSTASPAR